MPIKLYQRFIPDTTYPLNLFHSICSIHIREKCFIFFSVCFIFVVISYVDCTHAKSSKVSFVLMICIHNIYVIEVDKRVIRLCDNYCIVRISKTKKCEIIFEKQHFESEDEQKESTNTRESRLSTTKSHTVHSQTLTFRRCQRILLELFSFYLWTPQYPRILVDIFFIKLKAI